jgi:hypothetical protein
MRFAPNEMREFDARNLPAAYHCKVDCHQFRKKIQRFFNFTAG